MKKLLVGFFTSVVLLLFASITPALAQSDAPYVGFSYGDARFNDGDFCGGSKTCHDADTGFKVYGGIALDETLSVEYYYAYFGEASAEVDDKGPDNYSRKYAVEAYGIDAVAHMPLNERFSFFGKVGIAWWEWNAESVNSASNIFAKFPQWRTTGSDSGTGLKLGVGAKYNLQDNIDLRLEIEDYDIDGEGISLVSLGLTMGFDF